MDIVFNVPINRVSFGQVSYNLLKEAKKRGHKVFLIPIGPLDLATINPDQEMQAWLREAVVNAASGLSKDALGVKLWHLGTTDEVVGFRGSYERFCHQTILLSFYELDAPTKLELNVARQFDTAFTSQYTCSVFENAGVKTRFVPLGFDKDSFSITDKKYFQDDRIVFGMLGKFENRKHHAKMIRSWVKRFGNDKKYYLQCAIYNPFFSPQMNSNLLMGSMEGKRYWNVNPVAWVPTNQAYNDFLNSNHIVLAMSGGEGWGLPEFQSVCLGKHAVVLNAHAYKEWANEANSVLVSPLNMIPAADGVFFKENGDINQGRIFSWDEDEFIAACETAIGRHLSSPVNNAGLQLQNQFTYSKTFDALIPLAA